MAGRAKTRTKRLVVWMNGEAVAQWELVGSGRQQLRYLPEWLVSQRARPLSLSLPFTPDNAPHNGPEVPSFFDNLLPDRQPIRERLAAKHRAASIRAFDLLREIGRDCVGAIALLPEAEQPDGLHGIHGEPLTEEDIERLLQGVARGPMPGKHAPDEDLRISIAGAQEKTALLWQDGRWQRPIGATPSTHIFKLPLGRVGNMGADLSTSVENEWLCSRILAAYGLPVADGEIARFGSQKTLVVRRFDRQLSQDARWWLRIPQEDFCQALGIPSWRKYQADGGPGIADILKVLENSSERATDRDDFYRTQILFWMLAAPDGHAKNFSLFIGAGGRYRLTPSYDVLSAWPITGGGAGQMAYRTLKLAMAVRGRNTHYRMHETQRRHWNAMARSCALGRDVEPLIEALIERTARAIETVRAELPPDFPAEIAEPILDGLRDSAQRLQRMPA